MGQPELAQILLDIVDPAPMLAEIEANSLLLKKSLRMAMHDIKGAK
ncbi:hypothetical protein [Massilia psychrophila]|nr:hypothetical protein [Massilia psychrophila]